MAFLKEFKEFALKGNVMDMAVGVIIGGAFGKIVSSLVNDILMPPIGALIGNTDFSQLRLNISKVRDVTSNAMHSVGDMVTAGCRSGRTDLLELRRIHPAVRGFHDPGALRVPDGQADEPADEEKGRGSGSGSRSRTARTDERGAAAHRNPRPAERAEEISGKIPEPNSPAF